MYNKIAFENNSSFFHKFLRNESCLRYFFHLLVLSDRLFSPNLRSIFFLVGKCWQVMEAVYFLEGNKLFPFTWWPNCFTSISHFSSFSASLHSLFGCQEMENAKSKNQNHYLIRTPCSNALPII